MSLLRTASLRLLLLVAASLCAPAASAIVQARRVVLPSDTTPDRYRLLIVPDVAAMTFTGSVDIDVTVHQATHRIVLNSADLELDDAALVDATQPARIATDARLQTATFSFDRALAAGPHTLHIAYRGRINLHAAGLFALPYATPQGERRALFTQFENSDARRFVPCWDEPGLKAIFELSAVVPADEMALSNMPVASSQPLDGGLRRVRFVPTPRMSSYLLYFGSGDFERAHRMVDGVDVGVVTRRGALPDARYALDAAAQILPWYNAYFGTRFPLPKLDMVAGPGASQFFGAMENWGAIFYFERDLLIDPRVATEQDRQEVFGVVAHEMAHQWFGDLVTMAWWDDLWLNEGFASWMATKATDHFHPEWQAWLQAQEEGQAAMAIDAREGTHPVITPIADVLQAADAFDTITYSKGQMVIRTLESYLGEDAFRAGVRRYVHRYAYANTVTDDLWREMDRDSATPIAAIAHDLTRQAGVPMVTQLETRCVDGRTRLQLSQQHFAVDPAFTSASTWHVPLVVAPLGAAPTRVVVSGATPQSFSVEGCAPLLLNAGQASYLRMRYDAATLAALTANYARLSAADQLGLLDDTRSLAFNAQAPMAALLDLLRALPAEADPIVLTAFVGRIGAIDRLLDGLPLQARWRVFARARLAPVLARVGWSRVAGESANEAALRAGVLAALADFGDEAVVAEARRRFEGFVDSPAGVDAETRRTVLRIVAAQADAPTWDALHRLARAAAGAPERDELYALLGSARDVALARQALALALSGEVAVTTAPQVIAAVGVRHPRLAVDFAAERWSAIAPMLEPDSRGQFVPRLAAGSWDDGLTPVLERFARAHIPADARQELRKTEATIRDQARIRRERLPAVAAWLAQAGS